MRVNTRYINSTRWASFSSVLCIYDHARRDGITVGDSGLCSCVCLTSIMMLMKFILLDSDQRQPSSRCARRNCTRVPAYSAVTQPSLDCLDSPRGPPATLPAGSCLTSDSWLEVRLLLLSLKRLTFWDLAEKQQRYFAWIFVILVMICLVR